MQIIFQRLNAVEDGATLTNKRGQLFMPNAWFLKKSKRGVYMAGSIHSDVARCSCGGKFIKKDIMNYKVPVCGDCGEHPSKLRVIRYLPTLEGKGRTVDIRYDHRNKRIITIQQAIRVLEFIDYEIEEGVFDPRKYGNREVADQLKFRHFVNKVFIPNEKRRLEIGEISPGYFKDIKSLTKNHLVPALGD